MNTIDGDKSFKFDVDKGNKGKKGKDKTIKFNDIEKTLASSKIFSRGDIAVNKKFSRFGFIDPYRKRTVLKEFLFFTRPDLNLLKNANGTYALAGKSYKTSDQNKESLANIPLFNDVLNRYPFSMINLQSSCDLLNSPFMNILTNQAASRLDLPDITAEDHTTTPNIMGIEQSIRGHSHKSSNGYDFNVSFHDPDLSIYNMLKIYDEYHNLCRTGDHTPLLKYIKHMTVDDQFTVFKVLIDDDGETILYMCMIVGVYFKNVPRGDMSDPTDLGEYSVAFHGQHIVDDPGLVYAAFRDIVKPYMGASPTAANIAQHYKNSYQSHSGSNNYYYGVDNSWVRLPYIDIIQDSRSKRHAPKGADKSKYYDYRLIWLK